MSLLVENIDLVAWLHARNSEMQLKDENHKMLITEFVPAFVSVYEKCVVFCEYHEWEEESSNAGQEEVGRWPVIVNESFGVGHVHITSYARDV
mmetsp:Transcript_74060/g.123697  ORF Transcript_74060/g.123697 Transcript_74060/m.123697 type:complete len:93 (+) Transcript_74060:965-1243(+)